MPPHNDYWRVNSYGYPNPFSQDVRAREAWVTFLSFFLRASYSDLKRYWASDEAPRRISAHAVESWKATFEEFGLVHVPSGSDEIVITPAGYQFREAGQADRVREFAWIGLSLLLRYPLRGPRGRRRGEHRDSDLLVYWFLYAAIRELGNSVWWTELERILSRVFRTDEAQDAVESVRRLRSGAAQVDDFPLPSVNAGGFYNSLNQVIVHASMYYLLMSTTQDEALYPDSNRRRHQLTGNWIHIIDTALGRPGLRLDCLNEGGFISKLPKAPEFGDDEGTYFEYAGARIESMPTAAEPTPFHIQLAGTTVTVLRRNLHFRRESETQIRGDIAILCQLSRGQRLILTDDASKSYIVDDKHRVGPSDIIVRIRPGRPITNIEPLQSLFEGSE